MNEVDLLLNCLKWEPGEQKIPLLKTYNPQDWEAVVAAGKGQRVLPILYHNLKGIEPHLDIPPALLRTLREAYYNSAALNIRLYNQLLHTLKLFNTRSLEVILLKGAHLAEAVYGNIALRSMVDIDLLAKREDLKYIHDLMVEAGYSFKEEKQLSNTKHLPPYYREKGVSIEVHFQITDPPYVDRVDEEGLWERSQAIVFQDTPVRVLSPEDLYLHLCLHAGIQHGFEMGLVSCLDIAYVVKHYGKDMNWDVLWNRGEKWGIERSVYLMAALTEKVLGMTVPEELALKEPLGGETRYAVAAAEKMIFEKGAGTTRYMARLFGGQGWRVKLAYLKQRIFPPGDAIFEGEAVPEKKSKVNLAKLYCKRFITLFRRHSKTIWQALRSDPETRAALKIQNERNWLRDWMTGIDQEVVRNEND